MVLSHTINMNHKKLRGKEIGKFIFISFKSHNNIIIIKQHLKQFYFIQYLQTFNKFNDE